MDMVNRAVKMLDVLARLTRIEHALVLMVAVLAGETIVLGRIPAPTEAIVISLLVPAFIEIGSFALNDILDVKSDRANAKKDRPLVNNELSIGAAWAITIVAYAAGLGLAYLMGVLPFSIALIFAALSVAYNYWLKDLPLAGNAAIGASMAIPFVFGNLVINGEASQPVLIIAAIALMAGTAREIIKSVEDISGDVEMRGSSTLPVVIGINGSLLVGKILVLAAIALSFLPFPYLNMNPLALALVAAADLMLVYVIVEMKEDALEMPMKLALIAFAVATIGYLLAVIL
ncbi:hypothetical protein COX84_07125 [Candidatus Micrarchaeota archaeon CG_4_10_14_0_2_um_filter_49_7]|nr:MAG: hypothetical protein COX84_07125 [Candidatus Micrarchaeota archaeon CG_4_10_14_0_2_um_filter_49_7]